MAEELDESLDSCVPEPLVAAEPAVRALEWSRVDAAVVNAPANSALHEAGTLQGLDVLGRSGE